MKDLIGQRERIVERAGRVIGDTFDRMDRDMLRRLLEFLNLLDTSGDNLTFSARNAELLMRFKADVQNLISGNIDDGDIRNAIRQITDINKNVISTVINSTVDVPTLTTMQELFVDTVVDRVAGAGSVINNDMASVLFRHIGVGTTKSDVIREVKNLLSGSEESKYAQQIATDSIFQYDGMVQGHIAEKLNLDAFMFVGSLIETSREGCIHMINAPNPVEICTGGKKTRKCVLKENRFKGIFLQSGGFRIDDIPFIIEANRNDPGWNEATNEENYLSLRNGYNCRHQTVVYKMGRDEARINKLLEVYGN